MQKLSQAVNLRQAMVFDFAQTEPSVNTERLAVK